MEVHPRARNDRTVTFLFYVFLLVSILFSISCFFSNIHDEINNEICPRPVNPSFPSSGIMKKKTRNVTHLVSRQIQEVLWALLDQMPPWHGRRQIIYDNMALYWRGRDVSKTLTFEPRTHARSK